MSERPRREVFQGRNGRWYWRLRGTRGQILAIGGQSWGDKAAAGRQLRKAADAFHLSEGHHTEEVPRGD